MSRYQSIHSDIWDDEDFKNLSDQEQRLCLWFLTNRHNNIAGVYRLSMAVLQDEYRTQKGGKCFRLCQIKALSASVFASNIVKHDPSLSLVAIKGQYNYNPLINPNQVLSAIKCIKSLPKSLIYQYIDRQSLTKPFHQPLIQLLDQWLRHTETVNRNSKQKESANPKSEIVDNFLPDTKKQQPKASPSADSFKKNNDSVKPQSDPPTESAEPGKKNCSISAQEKETRRRIALKIDFLNRQDLPQFRTVNFLRLAGWLVHQGLASEQADQVLAKVIQYRDTISDPYPYCQKIAREMFALAIIQERQVEHKKNKNGDGDFSSAAELFAAFQIPEEK